MPILAQVTDRGHAFPLREPICLETKGKALTLTPLVIHLRLWGGWGGGGASDSKQV